MLFAMSDPVALAVVGVFNVLAAGIVGIVMFVLNERAAVKREEREAARSERADKKLNDLAEQGKGIAEVGQKSHDLANSAMLAQKKLLAKVTRAHAESTGSMEDKVFADAAELAYQEHLAGQKLSDAKLLAADRVIAEAKVAEQKANPMPPQPMH
jgi:hypothetical protein